ncbi:Hint domain-containing protein [Ancylobacter oerskovii]|uniref:Hint domain-containing protein n=1 Tax=Ancylobacter oerskovii TaxID=459519 RepID=A0ABW4YV18_9HYPH|nr:Hint domain-containing protein [Ancylobacter oerskovii]
MANYQYALVGSYDAGTKTFQPSFIYSGVPPYVVADGSYDVGDNIDVSDTWPNDLGDFELIGYTEFGWVGYTPADANGVPRTIYFTNNYDTNPVVITTTGTFVACFLAGTMIATPTGEVAIEKLKAGDLVLTHDGRAASVRWLALQTISTMFADPMKVMPIRVEAGALGDGLPIRDLYVSPDHALEIDGLLVQAGALVNGTTIARHTDMPQTFVYYHVELDDHSLILAEGVPAETFVDNVTRRRFDNWQEAPEAAVAEMDRPRVKSARQLPASIRTRISSRTPEVAVA